MPWGPLRGDTEKSHTDRSCGPRSLPFQKLGVEMVGSQSTVCISGGRSHPE